ncbi:unnamed protein product [Sphacelaria rigidula]
MARFAFVTVAVSAMISASFSAALEVTAPVEGDMVKADSTYTVEWEGTGDDTRVEIDLYYCGSFCTEDDCGEWVTALCPYGEDGCPDNEGDYDIVMPQPLDGVSSSGYKVRVADVSDESNADCSDSFYLLESEDVPNWMTKDGPHLYVTNPQEGDVAVAGDEYTVEFDYNDGLGSSVGRFKIDLYRAGGSGDCGTWVTSICDKPTIGCKDTSGDYDVEIPEGTPSGLYSIRVGEFSDDVVFGCSDVFEVVSDDRLPSGSLSYFF